MTMTKPAVLLLLGLASTSCQSTRSGEWRSEPQEVDVALLVNVSESNRQQIDEARADQRTKDDELAFAQRELERSKEDMKLAREELGIAKTRVDRSKQSRKIATGRTDSDVEAADEAVEQAYRYQNWVEARIDRQEALVERRMVERDLAAKRAELAAAQVQLAKAEAVEGLNRPDVQDIEVADYRYRVMELEDEIEMLEVDLEASKRKNDLHDSRIKDRTKGFPAEWQSSPTLATHGQDRRSDD